MLKRNTFVANAAFIAANPQGGNDIVGVLQRCDRVGGGTKLGNDSNLLIVFYVQIVPDDFVMQLHRF